MGHIAGFKSHRDACIDMFFGSVSVIAGIVLIISELWSNGMGWFIFRLWDQGAKAHVRQIA